MASVASRYIPSEHQRHTSSPPSTSRMSQRTSVEHEETDEKWGLIEDEEARASQDTDGASTYKKRHFINPDVVRDVIIGLSDGLTVPFALTAGLSGLDNSKIVVLGGLAELVSGAISMGVGGMLSAQAELDHFRYTQASISHRVKRSDPRCLEREVWSIFEPLGLSSSTSARVALELQDVEEEEWQEHQLGQASLPPPCSDTSRIPPSRLHFIPTRGLTPLLTRMGEGLEGIEEQRVWQSALTIGASYFFGGFIPLLPYLFLSSVSSALFVSIGITAFVLVVFGIVKQKCTGLGDWRSLLKSAMSTLAVGGVAAGSSWAIVRAMEG